MPNDRDLRSTLRQSARFVFPVVALGSAWVLFGEPTMLALSSFGLVLAVLVGLVAVGATWKEGLIVLVVLGATLFGDVLADWLRERRSFDTMYITLINARVFLVGWALLLWIPVRQASSATIEERDLPAALGIALLVGAIAVFALTNWTLTAAGHTGYFDEVLYIFQSRLYASGHLRAPLPDELVPFFRPVSSVASDGGLHTQYTPGWPFLLALITRVGLFSAPWVFGALTLVGVYRISRRLGGNTVAVFALLALILNPLFLRWQVGYLSHGGTSFCLVWMTVLSLDGERVTGWKRWLLYGAAGVLGGIAFAARPLTALGLGGGIWLWLCLRTAGTNRSWLALTGMLVLGALLPLAGFLWVNAQTNGSPFTLSYGLAHAGGHSLGFSGGTRVRYDALGEATTIESLVTPTVSLGRSLENLLSVARTAFPVGMALGLAWFAWRAGLRFRMSLPFLLLPVAYYFWPTAPIRTMSEGTPFVAIGLGVVLAVLWKNNHRWVGWALAMALGVFLVQTPAEILRNAERSSASEEYHERARELASSGPVVIFVNRGSEVDDRVFEWLWWFNATDWMGPIVVARDLGQRNDELRERFPGYTPYLVTAAGPVENPEDVPVTTLCPTDWSSACDNGGD